MKVILTGRDQKFLETLSDYSLLSTGQIRELIFKNIHKSAAHRRLRKLRKKRIIERIARTDFGEWVWTLGEKGRAHFGVKKLKINRNSLTHDLLCNDVRIKLEELKIARHFKSSFNLREKVSEKTNPRDRTLDQIPDWICMMGFNSGKRLTSIEVELNYKGKRRMDKVFDTYWRKKEIEKIVYFVSTLSMGKKMLELVKEYKSLKGETWFMFVTIDDFLKFEMESNVYFLGGKIKLNKISPVLSPVYGEDRRIEKLGA